MNFFSKAPDNFDFWTECVENVNFRPKTENVKHHQIQQIRITPDTTFQLKQKILVFRTKYV